MQVLELTAVGESFDYPWPNGTETFEHWIDYRARASDEREHQVRLGYCMRPVYGADRVRVVVFIDGRPAAEFFGADDFDSTGEVLSEIRVPGERSEVMCRYPEDAIPERYVALHNVGLPNRVEALGVHNAWAVVANVSDHQLMITLAALRNLERVTPR